MRGWNRRRRELRWEGGGGREARGERGREGEGREGGGGGRGRRGVGHEIKIFLLGGGVSNVAHFQLAGRNGGGEGCIIRRSGGRGGLDMRKRGGGRGIRGCCII